VQIAAALDSPDRKPLGPGAVPDQDLALELGRRRTQPGETVAAATLQQIAESLRAVVEHERHGTAAVRFVGAAVCD